MVSKQILTMRTLLVLTLLILNIIAITFASCSKVNAASDTQRSISWLYDGKQSREAHNLEIVQPALQGSQSFFDLSSEEATILGDPSQQHAFQPVHNNTIIQLNKRIDGNTWKYFGYDCDPLGSQINLFYSNDSSGTWIPYSNNPILGPKPYCFRWPSTTYTANSFYMFLENYTGGTLERWRSSDGINFSYVETIKTGGNQYKNPFIWYNQNNNRWYLLSHDSNSNTENIKVRYSSSLNGLRTASDAIIASLNMPFGSPTMMYYNGTYWLLAEILQDSQWQVVVYYSTTSPTSGFIAASNSPILTDDEACPQVFLTTDQKDAYLYTTANKEVWYEETRQIYLTSSLTITGFNVLNGGSGYTTPHVTISGGGGTGATATARVSNGVVIGVILTNPGYGYVSPPVVSLRDPNPRAQGASITINWING